MADESLEELKRRAYSRPGSEALDAQFRLAQLEQDRADEAWLIEHLAIEPPDDTAPARGSVVGLALLTLGVLVAATVTALTPPSSLDVFDRAQTARDISRPAYAALWADNGSLRWLGSGAGADVYGFYDGYGNVCLATAIDGNNAASCGPIKQFSEVGAQLTTSTASGVITVLWGPRGDPRIEAGR